MMKQAFRFVTMAIFLSTGVAHAAVDEQKLGEAHVWWEDQCNVNHSICLTKGGQLCQHYNLTNFVCLSDFSEACNKVLVYCLDNPPPHISERTAAIKTQTAKKEIRHV